MMPRGTGARNRRDASYASRGEAQGVTKALDPAPSGTATVTGDDLDALVDGIADELGVDVAELAALDRCATCDHMANQHDGACGVVGCDCGSFEATARADDEAAIEADALEYADTAGAFEVVGFQIALGNLEDRLTAATRALVAGAENAAPMVRLRLQELALRSFADGVSPPPDGGVGRNGLQWEAILAPEGQLTDDFRAFAPGSITWRELPLTLMAMLETADGHDGARVCGRIDVIWRDEASGLIRAAGVFDDSTYGREIARMVDEKVLRGNSVDLAIHDYEYGPRSRWFDADGNWAPTEAAAGPTEDDPVEILFDAPDEPIVYVVTAAVIGMSTVCPFPAFGQAHIEIAASLAAAGSPAVWTCTLDAGFRLSIQRPIELEDAEAPRAALLASAWSRTHVLTANEKHALGAVGVGASGPVGPVGPITAAAIEAGLIEPDDLTAATAELVAPPLNPPAEWFANPELEEASPIVITDDGRLYGHAAAWGTCHTGFPDVCVTPPHSETDYRLFHLKSVVCEDGTEVDCGTITLEAPHANQRLGRVDATAHYDNTGMAAADVVCGEDEHGIWVAGAVRPHLDAAAIRELRGAVLSGDWRNFEGNLELIALLAVNVPGFPVPRVHSRVAGGVPQALTAAGIVGDPLEGSRPLDDVVAELELEDATAQLAALADDQVAADLAELAAPPATIEG